MLKQIQHHPRHGWPRAAMVLVGAYGDGTVHVWDTETHSEKLAFKPHESSVSALCFIDESRVVSASNDGRTKQWNIDRNQLEAEFDQNKGYKTDLVYVPSRNLLAICGGDSQIRVWNASTHELHRELVGHEGSVLSVAASPDGHWLYSTAIDSIRRWDLSQLTQPMSLVPSQSKFFGRLVVTPNGKQVIRALASRQIGIFDLGTGELVAISDPFDARLSVVAIDGQGKALACMREPGNLVVLDAEHFTLLGSKTNLGKLDGCTAFFPGRPWIAFGQGKNIVVWNYVRDEEVANWEAHQFAVAKLQFSPDGKRLYSCSISGRYGVQIWNTDSWKQIDHLGGSNNSGDLELDSTGELLLTNARSQEKEFVLWDTQSLEQRFSIPRQSVSTQLGLPATATFSVVANRVAIIWGRNTSYFIQLWNLSTGREIVRFKQSGWVRPQVTFTPDGSKLVIEAEDAIYVWDGSNNKTQLDTSTSTQANLPVPNADPERIAKTENIRFVGNLSPIKHLEFNSAGTKIASAGLGQAVKLWDASTGQLDYSYDVRDEVTDVNFSSDDSIIAAALADGKVKLLKVNSPKESLTLRGHQGEIWNIGFRTGENHLVTLGRDGTVRTWNCDSGELMLQIQNSGGRQLAVHPRGKEIALLVPKSKTIRLLDLRLTTQSEILTGEVSGLSCLAYSSDGTMLALSAGLNGSVQIWNTNTQRKHATIKAHGKPIPCLRFDAKGRLYTSCFAEGVIKIWDIKSQHELKAIPLAEVTSFAIHPQAKMLAAACGKDIHIVKIDE